VLDLGELRPALECLRCSLRGSAPADSIARKLHALIVRAHQLLGEPEAAMAACAAGLAVDPDDAELLFRKGVLHRMRNGPTAAGACWRRILALRRPERFASLDVGIYGDVTRRNLAVLAEEQGDLARQRGVGRKSSPSTPGMTRRRGRWRVWDSPRPPVPRCHEE
jgi:hypothetical protein